MEVYVPGARLLALLLIENVMVDGVVLSVPTVEDAVSQVGSPEIV